MEENESVNAFISIIKELKGKLGVTITLNGMLEDYLMFIIGLGAPKKMSNFEELTSILVPRT